MPQSFHAGLHEKRALVPVHTPSRQLDQARKRVCKFSSGARCQAEAGWWQKFGGITSRDQPGMGFLMVSCPPILRIFFRRGRMFAIAPTLRLVERPWSLDVDDIW